MTFKKKITGKITKGNINVDGKELNFNEYVRHETKAFKNKYEGIEDRLRHKFFMFDTEHYRIFILIKIALIQTDMTGY